MSHIQDPVLGIDFGESKISIAVYDENGVRFLKSLPSCLFYASREKVYYGEFAKKSADTSITSYASNIKRLLIMDTASKLENYAQDSDTPLDVSDAPRITLQGMDDKLYISQNASDLAVRLFAELRNEMQNILGRVINICCVTKNTDWPIPTTKLLLSCLQQAGFQSVSTVDDIKAFFVGYTFHEDPLREVDSRMFVDIGLAETRIMVLNYTPCEIRKTTRIADGGRTIDHLLLDHCCEEFKKSHGFDTRAHRHARFRVLMSCENAKIILSGGKETVVRVENVHQDKHLVVPISLSVFRRLVAEGPAKRLALAIKEAKSKCHGKKCEIVVSGGGSNVFKAKEIRDMLQQGLDRNTTIHIPDTNPDHAAAIGAACFEATSDHYRFNDMAELAKFFVTKRRTWPTGNTHFFFILNLFLLVNLVHKMRALSLMLD